MNFNGAVVPARVREDAHAGWIETRETTRDAVNKSILYIIVSKRSICRVHLPSRQDTKITPAWRVPFMQLKKPHSY